MREMEVPCKTVQHAKDQASEGDGPVKQCVFPQYCVSESGIGERFYVVQYKIAGEWSCILVGGGIYPPEGFEPRRDNTITVTGMVNAREDFVKAGILSIYIEGYLHVLGLHPA